MRPIVLLILVFGLMSCTAKAIKVNYYLLYTPALTHTSATQAVKSKKVRLNKIGLADYLQQSSLTMQINQNQLYFSRQDVWAESLQSSIFKVLLAELNQDEQRQYIAYHASDADLNETAISIQFDHFHATDKSTVVAGGHFWINQPGYKEPVDKPFFLTLPLHEDGFAHSVNQQSVLLRLLATQIQLELDKPEP